MNRWDTVAVIGVGLIGGSVGLSLLRRGLARRVVGIGRRRSTLRLAKRCGVVSTTTTDLGRGVSGAELIVVCTPVGHIVQHVREAAEHCPRGAVITDSGSTKSSIVKALDGRAPRGVAFVGSHPLAGSDKSGPLSASAGLFQDRLVVITPTRRTPAEQVDRIERFWRSLGARTIRMSPRAHDEAVAATSHLPHLVASALAASTPRKHQPLAATGWLDTTRVAAGDAELWQQILADNRDHVLKSLGRFEKWLSKFRSALERNDPARVARLLKTAKQNRDAVGS